jgi:chromosome segregation ATPase
MIHSQPQCFISMPIALLIAGYLATPASGAGSSSGDTVVPPSRDADAYILSHANSFFSTSASVKDVESVTKRVDGDFLWVRRSGKEFVIRDASTIQEARGLFDSLDQFEPEREALQAQQDRLGSEQATLEDEEEKLEDELEALEDRDGRQVSDAMRATLRQRQVELESKMHTLALRESELDAYERELESRSDALEQKVEVALWNLIDQALTTGLGRALGRK